MSLPVNFPNTMKLSSHSLLIYFTQLFFDVTVIFKAEELDEKHVRLRLNDLFASSHQSKHIIKNKIRVLFGISLHFHPQLIF